MTDLEQTLTTNRAGLMALLDAPMREVADAAAMAWGSDGLDQALIRAGADLPRCRLLYALDPEGRQCSGNINGASVAHEWRGQDLSDRPYLAGLLPYQGMVLSPVYISQRSLVPCLTAVVAVRERERLLGFVAADFHISELPAADNRLHDHAEGHRQFRGDPAIRGGLFAQTRNESLMDRNMATVLPLVESLIHHHGVFHAKLHFSSTRMTLWHVDDPYNYQVHAGSEAVSPNLAMAYPRRRYPERARIAAQRIRSVFHRFQALREADETIYLRSGSLNVINGKVGLNFSCDGAHYMTADEFLTRDLDYWMGPGATRGMARHATSASTEG
ncbi:MAG: PDC sensor domain-containing protein [Pseudomonadota bacterium]